VLARNDYWLRSRNGTVELKHPTVETQRDKGRSASHSNESLAEGAASPQPTPSLLVDFYTEDRTWPAIAAALGRIGLPVEASPLPTALLDAAPTGTIERETGAAMHAAVARAGLAPFASITTHRTRFLVALRCGHTVNIDLDVVSFGSGWEGQKEGNANVTALAQDCAAAGAGSSGSRSGSYEVAEIELVSAASLTPTTSAQAQAGSFSANAAARAALAAALAELGVPDGSPAVRGKVLEYLHRYDPGRWQALEQAGLLERKLGGSRSLAGTRC
jgi:hypothetical protein